jgi:hypothetical protein
LFSKSQEWKELGEVNQKFDYLHELLTRSGAKDPPMTGRATKIGEEG